MNIMVMVVIDDGYSCRNGRFHGEVVNANGIRGRVV